MVWASGSQVCNGHTGSLIAKPMKNSQNRAPRGNNTPAPNMVPWVERALMSKVPTSGVRNTATIATSMKALPRMVNIKNFIAEYSLRPVPQMAMSMYIGISSSSQKRKNRSRSRELNTPITAVCSTNSQKKCSRTRVSMRHDASTAHNPRIPVRATNGALRPSTPNK